MNLVILGSAHKNSNTEKAVEKLCPFKNYELIDLLDHKVSMYNYDRDYPADDVFMQIGEKMKNADHILFATPVYWYAMSGLMKVFFDRFTNLMSFQSPIGRQLAGRKTYLIATGSDAEIPEGFEVPFKRTSEYFDMEFISTQYMQCDD